jgi:simple sugar transport system ATP-binding protein
MPLDAGTDGRAPAVELRGIDKRFGSVHANRAVDLSVQRGHIHGLIGENGAGKSTLMSILYGFYTADAGDILIDGAVVRIAESRDAIRHGIEMVHQHFMLVDTMTVLENVVLGAEGGALLHRHLPAARERLRGFSRDYGLDVDPDALVGDLPVGAQQRVEILKSLYRGADILILDEPWRRCAARAKPSFWSRTNSAKSWRSPTGFR